MPYQTASPWAIILCKFSDAAAEPFHRSYYENLFTNAGTGHLNLVDFMRDFTHGHLDIGGSEVFGWLTLPHARSAYVGDRSELKGWVRQAAADAGIDLTRFYGVVGCMNVSTDLFGGTDRNVITPNGNVNNDMSPAMLAQEMLHGYGAGHSRREGDGDYTDKWDAMSTVSSFSTPSTMFFSIGPGLNIANMDYLGWLNAQRIWRKFGLLDETIEIRPHYRRDLEGYLGARLGRYYVEYRHREAWDATIPRDCVLVHSLDGAHSVLMRSTTSADFDLVAGAAFAWDDGNQTYSIGVESIDPQGPSAAVRLVSASKVPLESVPDVRELYRDRAIALITGAGFNARITGRDDRNAYVVTQQPTGGEAEPVGTEVVLYCRMGPVP